MLHQVVTSPTHFSHAGSPSILNHVLPYHPYLTQITWGSRLNTCYVYLYYIKRPRTARRTVWCYAKGDFEKACVLLQQVDWNAVFTDEDVDKCWERWHILLIWKYCTKSYVYHEKSFHQGKIYRGSAIL